MSSKLPVCAKCGTTLIGKAKMENGQRVHEKCPVPDAIIAAKSATPVEVQQTADSAYDYIPPFDGPAENPLGHGLLPVAPVPEMRHIAFFSWRDPDGTVYTQTVRGVDFDDFQREFAAIRAFVTASGTFANAGYAAAAQNAQAPSVVPVQAATPAAQRSVPQSVADQTDFFEANGVKYGVGLVRELTIKTTTKGDPYMSVKVQPFVTHGVSAWKEVAEPHFGDLRLLIGQPIPIPADKKYVVFSMKTNEAGKEVPSKVVEFRANKD